MGEARKESYNSTIREMMDRVMEYTHDMQKAIETRCFYVSLLEDPKGVPSYFLGIDGQLRRNDCAYRLALAIHSGLITYEAAIEKLKKFSNDIIEKGRPPFLCPRCGKEKPRYQLGLCKPCYPIWCNERESQGQPKWEQLSLWNQSELDQI